MFICILFHINCDINSATTEDSEPALMEDDVVELSPLSHIEGRVAIQLPKNNKAAELFKPEAPAYLQNMAARKHAQRLEP